MTMRIDAIWEELEGDDTFRSGILRKRYSGTVIPDVYVAIRAPEKLRCLAAHINVENAPDVTIWDKLKDIKVEVLKDDTNPAKTFLLFLLVNQQHKDIFSALSEDLINSVSAILDEKQVVDELLNRLAKWQALFERLGQQGLSAEAQRGLYGELYFLRKILQQGIDKRHCISSWQEPTNKIQDFQHERWAVEVKTTHGNNHQRIQISNERQLDDSIIPELFLYHLSLDIRQNYGESLNEMVEWVADSLTPDINALNAFRLKLFEAGYFDVHRPQYSDTGYSIRQESIYKIEGDFPRITESDIRNGVGNVKYSIVVADCAAYKRDEHDLYEIISP
jgi:hypothetical protein